MRVFGQVKRKMKLGIVVVHRALGQPAQLIHNVLDGGPVLALLQKEPLGRL